MGRSDLNDIDEILALTGPAVDEIGREVKVGGSTRFTWQYEQQRPALQKLYEKAKNAEWNVNTDIDWSVDVDLEKMAASLIETSPEIALYRHKATTDPESPLFGWTDQHFLDLAIKFQSSFLSNIVHGEQGALLCTTKICEQVPWIDAKYYAATQVMDEARHVEVFIRYLDDKLRTRYAISGHLLKLIEDVLTDERWDITYLGMQIMIEGLALAAFGFIRATTSDPLLKMIIRNVMSDEARHVAFGVVSLKEVYDDMSAAEIRDRRGVRLRGRPAHARSLLPAEPLGVGRRGPAVAPLADGTLRHQDLRGMLFTKIVPNIKKLGLLDAGDGWLRDRYTDIGVIQFEDWVDTETEFEDFDISESIDS